MNSYKIYLAGKMSGLTYDEQMGWRNEISRFLEYNTAGNVKLTIISPPRYYNPNDENAASIEEEAMKWDLNQIRDSNIVVVNLDDIASSIGTHIEIGFINAMNSFGHKHIYVVGFGKTKPDELHPWIRHNLFHYEPCAGSAARYICDYLHLH